jgi:dihydrofolate synthase/folylpolyglutamate synthase
MKLGLENITALLEEVGGPERKFPSILVAGTNGKGSVTTFISSILRSAGLKTGAFYSPHLFRINERIRLNGEEIPGPVLDGLLGELREHHGRIPFTFFEGMTAAAALHFMRSGVDMAVFEVGLGGRLDATRLVDAALTVITGISVDHREHLGRTRAKILGEKLGITREGVPLVASLDSEPLLGRARRYCGERGVPMTDAREGVRRRLVSIEPDSMTFNLSTPVRDYGRLRTSMIGRAQMKNASTAVRCAELLEGRFAGIGEGSIREGLKKAFMQGRFQVMPGNPRVVLDVSHNEESLLAAMDTLARISPPEKNVLIFGIMARKETGRFPAAAARSARKVILVPLKDEGSATAGHLSEIFAAGTVEAPGMAEAIDLAAGSLGPGDTLLVLGSHVAVEEAAGCLDGPAARKGSRS